MFWFSSERNAAPRVGVLTAVDVRARVHRGVGPVGNIVLPKNQLPGNRVETPDAPLTKLFFPTKTVGTCQNFDSKKGSAIISVFLNSFFVWGCSATAAPSGKVHQSHTTRV